MRNVLKIKTCNLKNYTLQNELYNTGLRQTKKTERTKSELVK